MKLPTNEQLAGMSREQLLSLWALVRQFRIKLMGLGPLPESAIQEMMKQVPDQLMASIVEDNRKAHGVPQPSGLIPDEPTRPAPVRGTGWQSPRPLEPPPGVKHVDRIAEHFAALDKLETLKQLSGK